jgi:DNA-binding CsgD family transcriptional regulator
MSELTSQDFQQVSRCITQLYLPCLLADFPDRALHLLKQLVGSEMAMCQSFTLEGTRLVATDLSLIQLSVTPPQIPIEYLYQDPLIGNLWKENRWDAWKISDFVSSAEFHQNELNSEMFYAVSSTNVDDAITISIHDSPQQPNLAQMPFREIYSNRIKEDFLDKSFLQSQETLNNLFFGLARTERTFTERDREVLNLFRPHLLTAYHNVLHYTQLQSQLTQLTQVVEQFGTVLLSADAAILSVSDRAAEILQFYFPGECISGRQLPDPLNSWVKQQIKEFNTAQSSKLLKPWKITAFNHQLSIRLLKDAIHEQWILTFDESESDKLTIHSFCSIGLTKRQSEVLFWVIKGLSNAEIAAQLFCSDLTIKKHLENIYTKLNVQSRSMAVAIALNKMIVDIG